MFHRNPTTTFAGLNNEDLLAIVPSVFATAPVEGVSERYSFLPTASILDGMRDKRVATRQRSRARHSPGFSARFPKARASFLSQC